GSVVASARVRRRSARSISVPYPCSAAYGRPVYELSAESCLRRTRRRGRRECGDAPHRTAQARINEIASLVGAYPRAWVLDVEHPDARHLLGRRVPEELGEAFRRVEDELATGRRDDLRAEAWIADLHLAVLAGVLVHDEIARSHARAAGGRQQQRRNLQPATARVDDRTERQRGRDPQCDAAARWPGRRAEVEQLLGTDQRW